jgi:hypothetical protein
MTQNQNVIALGTKQRQPIMVDKSDEDGKNLEDDIYQNLDPESN